MDRSQIEDWLREGVRSAKQGETVRARVCLRIVVESDKENIQAWLWLSTVVATNDERLICLENVLVLDPDNDAARKGLNKLREKESPSQLDTSYEHVHFEGSVSAPSPTILNSKHSQQGRQWGGPIDQNYNNQYPFKSQSDYDDIWERDCPICSYCATVLVANPSRCPGCHRRLTVSRYRYKHVGADLYVYGTFIISLALFSAIAIVFTLLLEQPLTDSIWNGVLVIIMGFLFIGILMRQFWAFATSIVILLITLMFIILSISDQPSVVEIAGSLDADNLAQTLVDRPYVYVIAPLQQFILPIQILLVVMGLICGLLKVSPNFERVRYRLEARVDKGLSDSSQYYAVGKEYANHGMWASAVIHFQRAAALDPGRPSYLLYLGQAYYKTGFYQRSLDVLESGLKLALDPSTSERISTIMKQCQERIHGEIRSEE